MVVVLLGLLHPCWLPAAFSLSGFARVYILCVVCRARVSGFFRMAMAEMAPPQQKIVGKPASPFPPSMSQQQQQMQQHQQQQMQQHQQQQQQQQQQQNQQSLLQQHQSLLQQQMLKQKLKEKKNFGPGQGTVPGVKGKPDAVEVEMARQDLMKVCNPDIHRPFSSLEDACERLLPYHVVAEYDVDEIDDRGTDPQGSAAGVSLSRAQLWNETLSSKSREYFLALQKQIAMYNMMIRKRWEGDMRGEERLMVEQFLLEDEKQKLIDLKTQIDARDRAEKEAAEAKMKEAIAQVEKVRAAEAQVRAKAHARSEAGRFDTQADGFQAEMNLNVKASEPHVDGGTDQVGGGDNMYWESDAEEDGDGDNDDDEEGEGEGDSDGMEDDEDDAGGTQTTEVPSFGVQEDWGQGAQFDLNARTGISR